MDKLFRWMVLGTFALAGEAAAQIPAAPRELGMGGAYLGVARGYEAVLLAPANLGLADTPRWSVAIPQLALGGTLLGPGFGDLRAMLDYRDLPVNRQEELLSLVPGTGTEGRFHLRAPVVAISRGGFGLGASYVSAGRHTLSRDLAELFLRGYEDGRASYSVGNTSGQRATFWDFAAAYARREGSLSLGVTAHYVTRASLVRTRLFAPRVDVEARQVEVDYVGLHSRGGRGYAVDFAAAYQASPAVTISAALSNAISSMDWSKELHWRSLTLDRELIEGASPMDLMNRYRYSDAPVDPVAPPPAVADVAPDLFENAEFPKVGRIGWAWKASPSTTLAADYHRKLSTGRLADPWDRRFAIGLQQRVWVGAVRLGYARGNDDGRMVTGGVSIGTLDLGVGRYQHSRVSGDPTRGWIGSLGLGVAQPF